MTPEFYDIVIVVMVSLAVGALIGGLGGGGGLLAVPAFVYGLGMDAHKASTLSLVVVAAAAISALALSLRSRQVRWGAAGVFAAFGAVGSTLGASVAGRIDAEVLMLCFALFVVVVTVRVVVSLRREGSQPQNEPQLKRSSVGRTQAVFSGLGIGGVTGAVGVGGGFLVTPTMSRVLGFPMAAAVATSTVVIFINSLSALGARWALGFDLSLHEVVPCIAAAAVGSLLGRVAVRKLPERRWRWAMVGLLALSATAMTAQAVVSLDRVLG